MYYNGTIHPNAILTTKYILTKKFKNLGPKARVLLA